MEKKLFTLALVNEVKGWDLSPEDIMVFRDEGSHLAIVLNRGIQGCPKLLIPADELAEYIDVSQERQEDEPNIAVADLTQIPGVGPSIQDDLYMAGYYNYADLAKGHDDDLLEIVSPGKLQKIRDYLAHLDEE